jgi:hypothetical protein
MIYIIYNLLQAIETLATSISLGPSVLFCNEYIKHVSEKRTFKKFYSSMHPILKNCVSTSHNYPLIMGGSYKNEY